MPQKLEMPVKKEKKEVSDPHLSCCCCLLLLINLTRD